MHLFVYLGEAKHTLEVDKDSDTLAAVKAKIEDKSGIKVQSKHFLYNRAKLDDDDITLASHGICRDSTLYISDTLTVLVVTGERTISITAESAETVADLKCHIETKDGIPTDQQQLVHAGKPLKDHYRLDGCGVTMGSQFHLTIGLPGGQWW